MMFNVKKTEGGKLGKSWGKHQNKTEQTDKIINQKQNGRRRVLVVKLKDRFKN